MKKIKRNVKCKIDCPYCNQKSNSSKWMQYVPWGLIGGLIGSFLKDHFKF